MEDVVDRQKASNSFFLEEGHLSLLDIDWKHCLKLLRELIGIAYGSIA